MDVLRLGRLRGIDIHPMERKPAEGGGKLSGDGRALPLAGRSDRIGRAIRVMDLSPSRCRYWKISGASRHRRSREEKGRITPPPPRIGVFEIAFQPRLFGRGLPDVLFLDVAVAADGFGDAGDFGQQRDLLALQRSHALIDHREIILDQLAFGLALRGAAERIEGRAAQEFQFRQHSRRRAASSRHIPSSSAGRILSRCAKIGGAR